MICALSVKVLIGTDTYCFVRFAQQHFTVSSLLVNYYDMEISYPRFIKFLPLWSWLKFILIFNVLICPDSKTVCVIASCWRYYRSCINYNRDCSDWRIFCCYIHCKCQCGWSIFFHSHCILVPLSANQMVVVICCFIMGHKFWCHWNNYFLISLFLFGCRNLTQHLQRKMFIFTPTSDSHVTL